MQAPTSTVIDNSRYTVNDMNPQMAKDILHQLPHYIWAADLAVAIGATATAGATAFSITVGLTADSTCVVHCCNVGSDESSNGDSDGSGEVHVLDTLFVQQQVCVRVSNVEVSSSNAFCSISVSFHG